MASAAGLESRLGHTFQDPRLLEQALTHSSYVNEHPEPPLVPNERLEFYHQAEAIMQEEVAYIPIVYRNAYDVYKPWVKGVPINSQGFALPNGNIYVGMWNTVYTEGRPE